MDTIWLRLIFDFRTILVQKETFRNQDIYNLQILKIFPIEGIIFVHILCRKMFKLKEDPLFISVWAFVSLVIFLILFILNDLMELEFQCFIGCHLCYVQSFGRFLFQPKRSINNIRWKDIERFVKIAIEINFSFWFIDSSLKKNIIIFSCFVWTQCTKEMNK